MGKGDKKSRRGKTVNGTYGVRRPRKKNKTTAVVTTKKATSTKAKSTAAKVTADKPKAAAKPKAAPKKSRYSTTRILS